MKRSENYVKQSIGHKKKWLKNEYVVEWLCKIERGETKLHLDKLEQIAQILDIDIVELINSGERNVFVQFNENSHFGSSFQGDNEKSLLIEIEKLKLSLSHCQQLLEEKEGLLNKLVEQKDNEIKLLREMVELLKKG